MVPPLSTVSFLSQSNLLVKKKNPANLGCLKGVLAANDQSSTSTHQSRSTFTRRTTGHFWIWRAFWQAVKPVRYNVEAKIAMSLANKAPFLQGFFPGFPGNRRKWIFRNIELLAKIPWVMGKILKICVKFLGVLTKIVEFWWKFLELWAKILELWRKLPLSYGKISLSYLKIRKKNPWLNTLKPLIFS